MSVTHFFDQLNRQLMEIVHGTFPVYYPNNECMCTEDRPMSIDAKINPEMNRYCLKLSTNNNNFVRNGKLRTDAALPDDTRFFSSQYITDGLVRMNIEVKHEGFTIAHFILLHK